MSFRFRRLGAGDWLIGAGSVLLLVDLFAVTWFRYRPRFAAAAAALHRRIAADGWQTSHVAGSLAVVVCLTGIAIFWFQGARRSPALPVVLTTLLAPVSLVLLILLTVRVLIASPSAHLHSAGVNAIGARPGAYAGVGLSVLIAVGIYLSLRREGVAPEDSTEISSVA